MTALIPSQTEKCKGAMLATAIGDALGWPNEPRAKNKVRKPKIVDHFVGWTRRSNNPRWHDENILPGEYSDDTQLTLAVARSIITDNWEKFFAEKELPFWLSYERGGGGALLKAAKSCSKNKVQLWQSNFSNNYFNAGGNGATMRILPHVIAAAKTPNTSTLMLEVVKNAIITHGHPRAILGATCYAYALDFLLRKDKVLEYGELVAAVFDGEKEWNARFSLNELGDWFNVAHQHRDYDYEKEWEITHTRMMKQLNFIQTSLKKGLMLDDVKVLSELECFGTANGAGDVAVLAAIYLASRYANNPSLGIKVPAFSFGADTDTIASITGGLVGMLNGMSWIPTEWKTVQDRDCLIQITELLLADNKREATKVEVIEAKTQDSNWVPKPIGEMRLDDSRELSFGKNGTIIIEKWQTALGQTLYIKEFQPYDSKFQTRSRDVQTQMPQQSSLPNLFDQSQDHLTELPKNSVREIARPQKLHQQFSLNSEDVISLLSNPQFKKAITVGKVLNIIQALIEGNEANKAIAKRLKTDQAMINLIEAHIKNITI